MFTREDTTFKDIRERSVMQWLEEIKDHEDLVVRGGVKVTTEYIEDLRNQIEVLKQQSALKDEYMKKVKEKLRQK